MHLTAGPYVDDYAACEFTCAKLVVVAVGQPSSVVSERLGLEPTAVSGGGAHLAFSSERVVASRDVRRHLDWLLDRIEPVAPALRDLQRDPDVRTSVRCVWWSKGAHGGPTLWPEQLVRLAALGLELGFDVCFFGHGEP